MFNLLGNLLFGYRQTQEEEENQKQSAQEHELLQQTESASQSTQTLDNSNVNNETNNGVVPTVNRKPEDWVIVDRSEEADKELVVRNDASTNTSMIQSKVINEPESSKEPTATLSESNHAILGSFFEKNEQEDEEFNRKYKSHKLHEDDENIADEQTTTKDWLITPLPCLTSITASQRSIVENDPLENLLIEHPSMSVFVAATSSTSSSDASFQEEDDIMNIEENIEIKMVIETMKAFKELERNIVLSKSFSEKRKMASVAASEVSPTASLKRKGKKNKKSTSGSPTGSTSNVSLGSASNHKSNNKENFQQVLLANDFKKQAGQARLEALLLNKNQMKRANKNSVFAAAKQHNANCKQRKYHKLQQPSFLSNKPVF